MGKKTDKLYITHSEWSNQFSQGGMYFGGARTRKDQSNAEFKRLPFYCCSLSLQPFKTPVCTKEGYIFEYENILHWLSLHKNTHPITGEALLLSDLVHLHFHSSELGFRCPITLKDFTDASHIVAIATSGNVYSYDAIKELNLDPKYWFDLLDDSIAFKRKDLITLQDPKDLSKRNFEDFWYVKHSKSFRNPNEQDTSTISTSGLASKVLKEMSTTTFSKILHSSSSSSSLDVSKESQNAEFGQTTVQSTGELGASFTSTSRAPQTQTQVISLTDQEFMYQEFTKEEMDLKKKNPKSKSGLGYVNMKTNLGDFNVELFCVQAPQTCHNFLSLCENGYYKGVTFHRSIPGFMIQGGDPTGTGRGGKSAFGKDFKDEIRPSMTHNSRGLLSMANRGKNTNSSQFFITFAPCTHLDGKHTIFGKLVNDIDTLDRLESIETDELDRPIPAITILDVQVLKNPFEEWRTKYHEKQAQAQTKPLTREEQLNLEGTWLGPRVNDVSSESSEIGKYLKKPSSQDSTSSNPSTSSSSFSNLLQTMKRPTTEESSSQFKKKSRPNEFGDFSSW